MTLFLKKIDKNVVTLYFNVKKNIPLEWFIEKFPYFKSIYRNFFDLINNVFYFLKSNFEENINANKLFTDIIFVYISNKEFILYCLRVYIYISIILYFITYVTLVTILFFEIKSLIMLGQILSLFFHKWMWPIKVIKKYLKCAINVPFSIFKILCEVLKVIKSSCFKNNINECMDRKPEDGKSPSNGRKTELGSTEWELNCTRNRWLHLINSVKMVNNLKDAGRKTSSQLDFDFEHRDHFKDVFDKHMLEFKKINDSAWCPSWGKREDWNREHK